MTKEESEDYIDSVIKHALSLVEYSNYFVSMIKGCADEAKLKCDKILLEHTRSVTKKQKKECESEIDEVLAEFKNKVDEFVAEQLKEIADTEEEYLQNIIGKALGLQFIIPVTAVSILSLIPIASAGTAKDFGNYITERLDKIYESAMNRSYTFGEDYNDILDDIEPQFNSFERGLNSDAETMGYSLANEYDRIVYTKNDKKITGYVWIALLDGNTCLECAALSGNKYKSIEDVPYYPRHNRDRCLITPYTEDTEDVIPESYEEWFEKQDKSEKRKILGKTRFQLYEQGMKIKKFVNNGEVTPVKELKEKYLN